MTIKELAKKEYLSVSTLIYFMEKGWVNAPHTPNDFNALEAAQAHINIRETIAYQRGWVNCKRGYGLEENVGFSN